MTSHRKQTGFTMIELIVVIVILGILAATALPKFIDLRGDAITSAVNGVAGNLASASAVNYAGCSATGHSTAGANAAKCVKISNCQDVPKLLQGVTPTAGAFSMSSTNYTIATDATLATNGTSASCQLTGTNGSSTPVVVSFTGIGAGN